MRKLLLMLGLFSLSTIPFAMADNLPADMTDLPFPITLCDEAIDLENIDLNRAKLSNSFKKKHKHAIATPLIFQNPFMAPNNFSEIHNNAYQTDTFSVSGPGRKNLTSVEGKLVFPPAGIGATLGFNSLGQIITIRTSIGEDQQMADTLLLMNPENLEIIARTDLPPRVRSSSQITFSGAYFYLDNQDRAVCVTGNQEIRIYAVQNNQFVLINTFNLANLIGYPSDLLNSVLPDSKGNFWFITEQALIGYGTPNGNFQVTSITNFPGANPNETNSKSFATDEDGGVYALTDYALYRYQVGPNGSIEGVWRAPYDRGTRIKPGQNQQGSGTTPTVFNDFEGNKFITIADNADPFMHVLVFNRLNGKLVAKQAVFKDFPNENSCENSLIAVNRSIMIENNYGNQNLESTAGKRTTVPGLARIDFNPNKTQKSGLYHSKIVWENNDIAIPSVVTGLSTKDGLIYTYAKDSKSWYFTAVNYENGKIFAKVRVPRNSGLSDILANNFYSGLNVGPNGNAYVSVVGGFVMWRSHQ